MNKANTNISKLTRGDKTHKKFIDRLNILNDCLTQSSKSITIIHKQTLDSSATYYEKVSKSQEPERAALYDIIKTCKDESKCKRAFARLAELDKIKEKDIEMHNELIQSERNTANRNITGGVLFLATTAGLISNKHIRQMTGKAFSQASKNLLRIKG